MADGNNKVLEKVAKLLRLAAPDSGTTEPERASAALTAAELIAKHGLMVVDVQPPEPKKRRDRHTSHDDDFAYAPVEHAAGRPWGTHSRPFPAWFQSVVTRPVRCAECGGVIQPYANVFMKADATEYVHRPIYV